MSRLFLLILLLLPTSVFAQTRCVIQITSGYKNMNILQLCKTGRQGKQKLPIAMIAPFSVQGPINAVLPVNPSEIRIKKQGCDASVTSMDEISVNNSSPQCQVKVSYSFAHLHKDYFVVFKNITDGPVTFQVVTRSTPVYYPQVRPLRPYMFSREDDTSGAWQYMSMLDPVRPGERIVVVAARQPDRGFIGGWVWLWGALAMAGIFLVVGWRRNHA